MNAEEDQDYIMQGGSALLQFDTEVQSRRVTLREIKFRTIQLDDGEWLEASSDNSWNVGRGRSIEAAIISLLTRVMGVDTDGVG